MRATYNESADDRSGSAEPREVRRYPNRRMYDTRERCYVALDEIGRWIREGQHVRVVDVKTNEDVTIAVLLPLLVERLSTELRGEGGAAQLHEWLRRGILTELATAATAIHAVTAVEAPSPAPSLPSLQSRLEQLEQRVQALELKARRSEV